MSVFSLVFEGIVAALMVALIVYCVRLDRRLAALRESDSGIRVLIDELQAAAARAAAATERLKSAGLEAERSLAETIRTAQAAHDDLVRRSRVTSPAGAATRPAAAPARPPAPGRGGTTSDEIVRTFDSDRGPVTARASSRSDAEKALLDAIRIARAEVEP